MSAMATKLEPDLNRSSTIWQADGVRGSVPSAVSRRDMLIGGLCLCCLPRTGFAAQSAGVEEVADGIFIRRGPDVEATPENRNGISNVGFIIWRDTVLVVDPGGSLADGKWLHSQIREKTDRPISHVVVTHAHPDHCFGAAAFKDDGAEIVGHSKLRPALEARGEFYRERLVEMLGENEVGPVVMPTQEVGEDGTVIELGGRTVNLMAHGTAHTSCDLSLVDSASRLLFTGDLLFVGRVPSLDGSLLGWLTELQRLRDLGAEKSVPGHGPAPVDTATAIDDLERYLSALRDETRLAIGDGRSLGEAVEIVAQGERDRWTLFDEYNGRNVTQAYKELEWE